MNKKIKIAAVVFLLAFSAAARADSLLASFSCARPETPDAGTQFNVELATQLIDGVVLGPGEIFSFNRTLDKGRSRFREGRSFYGGRVVMSRGGGSCQVSTALYNATLLANLEQVERWQHSLYDPDTAYVPAGLDASVSNSSGADYRFRNTTANPLTISARFEGGAVKIELLGEARRRKRWLTTSEPVKLSHTTRTSYSDALPQGVSRVTRPGFDGYIVKRYLNYLDLKGNTHTVYIGKDQYRTITEWVEIGR
jgi:vancomycin resistance protein YoaR